MYIRAKKNTSGTQTVQIIEKQKGKSKIIETIGTSKDILEINILKQKAKQRLEQLKPQLALPFLSEKDSIVENFLKQTPLVQNIGPERILGKIFDSIGLNRIPEELFRHIVLARLLFPVSKLKTTEYLLQHHGISVDVVSIYRFLDKFHKNYQESVEKIIFKHSKKILGEVQVLFYDVTTLYFEAEDEDDLRRIGFSKDGKFQCPQILLGLLLGKNGYPLGYDIFEGNKFEGHTIIPIIEQMQKKYKFPKPIIIADSGLLSKTNIQVLTSQEYEFILGARIKNETDLVKDKILEKAKNLKNGETFSIKKETERLIISYSEQRAKKDTHNRKRGLKRLEKQITSGKLSKSSINNRGYNKFLEIKDEIKVLLNESKIEEDKSWDGLKGYITNSKLSENEVIENYKNLWEIERAFRISKTDLRIRPIYHQKEERIKAHLCIAFAAYAVYKELERKLKENKIDISAKKAIEQTKTIFEIIFELPDSGKTVKIFNKLSEIQEILLKM